jgi:hypothetical protein
VVVLSVVNASNLGAFQATVTYDPAILTFVSSTSGSFLGATGRPVLCPEQPPTNGQLPVVCVTLGAVPPPGVTGDGDLILLTFQGTGAGTTAIALSGVTFTDPNGSTIAPAPLTIDGTVTVDAATPTPCAGVCPTPIPTFTPTPFIPPGGPTLMSIDPPAASGATGQEVSVDVVISNVSNLGAFQFDLAFDGSAAGVIGVTVGPFLGATGRTVFCVAPGISPNDVTYGCASQGASLAGSSGSGILASVTFVMKGASSTSIRLVASAADVTGGPIVISTADGLLTNTGGPTATPTPCVGTCPTPTSTATLAPSPTPVSFPVSCVAASTVVCIQPVNQTATVGAVVDVGIVASNVADLGAFQFSVTVDPAVLQPLGASEGVFLGSTGRTTLCVAPVVTQNTVEFACGSLGSEPPAGPNGSGVIATVHFQVLTAGTSAVVLSNTIVTDPKGFTIPAVTEDGSISSVVVTPTPCPGVCPTATPTSTPSPSPTPLPISCPGTLSATMCLIPSTQTVAASSTFTVQVIVDRASNLGSYEFRLAFDQVRLAAVTAVDYGFLASTGRTVVCPPPVIGPGTIDFGCASIGTTPPGPTAPSILATVTFSANLAGTSALSFTKSTLSDPLANPIPVTAIDGSVVVN